MISNHFNTLAEVYFAPAGSESRFPHTQWVFEKVEILPTKVEIHLVNLRVEYLFVNKKAGLRHHFIFQEYSGGGPLSFLVHKYKLCFNNWLYDGLEETSNCWAWCQWLIDKVEDPNTEMVISD